MADSRPSNWHEATKPDEPRCPKCGETSLIEINECGQAYCAVCAHDWSVRR